MSNISPTYIAAAVALIIFVAKIFNINLQEQGLTELITEVVGIISAVVILIRRYRQGDITIFGGRKTIA